MVFSRYQRNVIWYFLLYDERPKNWALWHFKSNRGKNKYIIQNDVDANATHHGNCLYFVDWFESIILCPCASGNAIPPYYGSNRSTRTCFCHDWIYRCNLIRYSSYKNQPPTSDSTRRDVKMDMFKIKKLTKNFQNGEIEEQVLKGINLTLKEGEVTALVGAAGSGKSTLLTIAAGLQPATSGEVIF